ESVAYTVCQHFGIDTSDYSFAYVAGWSSGKEMPELKESMDTIRKTASQLITGIEDALKEIKLEREQSQEIATEPTYEIWQLKNTPENRDLAFESTKHLKAEGKTVDKANYELVYSGKLEEGTSLEDLYTKFNIDHPEDFRGHSMSVSDVVVIRDGDGERAHFVDSVGFTEVPEFLVEKSVNLEKSGLSMDSNVTDNSQEADRPARALDEGSVSQPGETTPIAEDTPKIETQEPVTFIVAECSEFHSLGECHEGIATTEEAVEIFESIPADRMNGIKSIGISVPNADDGYPVELDVLVGHTFDLDLIEYVPQIKDNSQAMEMIAELMDRMPEMEVRGEIPAEIQEHLDQIHEAKSLAEELSPSMQLASEIDQFMYDYDTYAYRDQVPDREAQVAALAADLDNGEAEYMKQYLSEIVEHQEGSPEDIEGAKKLIEKIDDFKPLAKIEEQLEENYNHIDNTLNNLKKPSEERAETAIDTDDKQEEALNQADSDSGRKTDEEKQKKRASKRPSLKKRLEEKKEQVAAQPVKPAPEKEKVKSNGRGLNDE
ncbi:MAG: YodL domain-containing protein, partial [Lachnospiraceae bacterium]|nr:YodL domain-containing protein [Lachnospiraceae bacterium]